MNNNETLGDRLISLRKQKGLKQKDVAEALGFTAATYNRYEKNINTPKADKILSLANFFNVTPDFLLFGTDNKNLKEPEHNEEQSNILELYPTKENLLKYGKYFDIVIPKVIAFINKNMPIYDINTDKKVTITLEEFKSYDLEYKSKFLSLIIKKIIISNDTIQIFYNY